VLALFTDFVTNEIVQYGYLAIFVLMLLESAAVPIPSEVTMLFGGALASTGFVHNQGLWVHRRHQRVLR